MAANFNSVVPTDAGVSTHSHPKVAAFNSSKISLTLGSFNTQPPEGGCKANADVSIDGLKFQHTATRRWLPGQGIQKGVAISVSTHSHPKVAASINDTTASNRTVGFNTQPPEGGCTHSIGENQMNKSFNTQPPEGGCKSHSHFIAT